MTTATGRPRGVLDPERRRLLVRRARRVARLESQLEIAREQLASDARAAAAEGGSWSAIGEAIGLSKAATGALLGRAPTPSGK